MSVWVRGELHPSESKILPEEIAFSIGFSTTRETIEETVWADERTLEAIVVGQADEKVYLEAVGGPAASCVAAWNRIGATVFHRADVRTVTEAFPRHKVVIHLSHGVPGAIQFGNSMVPYEEIATGIRGRRGWVFDLASCSSENGAFILKAANRPMVFRYSWELLPATEWMIFYEVLAGLVADGRQSYPAAFELAADSLREAMSQYEIEEAKERRDHESA